MTIAAVVLAAGASSRFGSPKALARLDGRPILEHVLDAVREAGIHEVVVLRASQALVRDGEREGMADRVAVAQEIDCLAAIAHAIGLEQLAPFVELAARLGLDLSDVGYVSAGHRFVCSN